MNNPTPSLSTLERDLHTHDAWLRRLATRLTQRVFLANLGQPRGDLCAKPFQRCRIHFRDRPDQVFAFGNFVPRWVS